MHWCWGQKVKVTRLSNNSAGLDMLDCLGFRVMITMNVITLMLLQASMIARLQEAASLHNHDGKTSDRPTASGHHGNSIVWRHRFVGNVFAVLYFGAALLLTFSCYCGCCSCYNCRLFQVSISCRGIWFSAITFREGRKRSYQSKLTRASLAARDCCRVRIWRNE